MYSMKVGDVLHFEYLSLGKSEAIDLIRWFTSSRRGLKACASLMEGASRFVWL